MRRVQILVNGMISHVDYDGAMRMLRETENWINAFPLTSGRYTAKLIPFKRHLSPIVLDDCRIVTLMPFVDKTGEEMTDRLIQKFVFSALVSLSSSEHEAIEFSLLNGTWLLDKAIVTEVFWSAPALAGQFDAMLPPEARSL